MIEVSPHVPSIVVKTVLTDPHGALGGPLHRQKRPRIFLGW